MAKRFAILALTNFNLDGIGHLMKQVAIGIQRFVAAKNDYAKDRHGDPSEAASRGEEPC